MGSLSSKKMLDSPAHSAQSPFLLAEELQYLLFTEYFALNDLLACRLVSREWKLLLEDYLPRLVVDVKFNAFADRIDVECKHFRITTIPINAAVRWPPNVRVRSIKWHSYNDNAKRSNLKRLAQVLKLRNCSGIEELQLGMTESQIPREILQPNLSLKAIYAIRKNWIKRPYAALEEIEGALKRFRKLKRFDLSYNGDHDRLLKLFSANPSLNEFAVQSDNFTGDEIVKFIRSVPSDRSTGTVSLSYVNDDQYDQVLMQYGDEQVHAGERALKVVLEKSDVYEMRINLN